MGDEDGGIARIQLPRDLCSCASQVDDDDDADDEHGHDDDDDDDHLELYTLGSSGLW